MAPAQQPTEGKRAPDPTDTRHYPNPPKVPYETAIPKDQSLIERAEAPLATLSSHVDPWPHFIMSSACAGGAAYNYLTRNQPKWAMAGLGFSALYLFAGHMLQQGQATQGYDLGSVTSLALLAAKWKGAMAGDTLHTTFAALGGISAVANLVKSYQFRTGRPHELEVKRP